MVIHDSKIFEIAEESKRRVRVTEFVNDFETLPGRDAKATRARFIGQDDRFLLM